MQVGELRGGIDPILKEALSSRSDVENRYRFCIEISGLWMSWLIQYLFHSKPRSSVSKLDLKICTSNE